MVDEEDSVKDSTFKTRRRRRRSSRFWWTRKKTMHDDDRARRRRKRRRKFFQNFGLYYRAVFPTKKNSHHPPPFCTSPSLNVVASGGCVSRMVSSSSRVLFARVPSISFPVRMVDGVRVTGVQHSLASSSFPIPSTSAPLAQTSSESSSESSSKGGERWSFPRKSARSSTCVSLWSSWSSSSALLLFVF